MILPEFLAALTLGQHPSGQFLIGLAGFGLGLLACALLAIIEFGAWALVLPPRANMSDAAEPPGEAVPISTVADDGVRLAGRWYPAAENRRTGRTALLLHGFAESSDSLQAERVAALQRGGWSVAMLDLRGYGLSSGPFATFGGRETGDARAWLDRLQSVLCEDQKLEPILWGRSMGAAIALRAAADDLRIRALVLESPMVDLDEAVAVWFRKRRLLFPRFLARLVTRRAGRLAGVSLTRPNAFEIAPRVYCPVLILHGSDDTLVLEDDARRLAALLPTAARFINVSGAGHGDVLAIGGDSLLEAVMDFLGQIAT
jgi:pimeloyl-ACP methyl ester carboxylesterase